MKPALRCHYWGDDRPLVNLGDALVPLLVDALGFRCLPRSAADGEVLNPGRCLLVIGSLLTERDLGRLGWPADVWGCGWKGLDQLPSSVRDVRVHAARGPLTRDALGLPATLPLGDPALLLPRLLPRTSAPSGGSLIIPHCFRVDLQTAAERRAATGCDEVLSPLVWCPPHQAPGLRLAVRARLTVWWRWRRGFATFNVVQAVQRLARARFVLTGSLHGAILAQAYGVPWACYTDGYLDAPAKWADWASLLGVDLQPVDHLAAGEHWWRVHGQRGRLPSLDPLLAAFPWTSPASLIAKTGYTR